MKKLLVLGGISAMSDIVISARKMNYYVIVADYLENSPAKKYADEAWLVSITDVDKLEYMCAEKHIDGVMNYCIDPGQKPYRELCSRLGLPCIAGKKQFDIMTNKDRFADALVQNGLQTVQSYEREESDGYSNIVYPVVVKPVDGRASKGISICHSEGELKKGISVALGQSNCRKVRIETYQSLPEICAKYFVADGRIFFTTMADVHIGRLEDGTRVYLGTQTYPSIYLDKYLETTHNKVCRFIHSIGVENGALSFTGFYDNGVFRFFDPSLRMGGAQDWIVAYAASGINIANRLSYFAVHGNMGDVATLDGLDLAFRNCHSALFYINIGKGTIEDISGIDSAIMTKGVVGFHCCHKRGDAIESIGTADNVAMRFVLSCDTKKELVSAMQCIQSLISIRDYDGNDMIVAPFDAATWGGYTSL